MEFIKAICTWKDSFFTSDCVSIVIAIFTLVVTISIPVQIMKFQRYLSLMPIYMGFDVANAFMSVINFFHDDCDCDVGRIPEEYKKRFKYDFDEKNNVPLEKILHYQRRLLNDYFFELESCRKSSWILRRKIEKEWTSSEAWVVKILIFMNAAVDNDPELFKNISGIKHDRLPKIRGLNKYLKKFYDDLSNAKRWMQS